VEQEVIIVDLAADEPRSGFQPGDSRPETMKQWWAKADSGVIDPRLLVMELASEKFDRILDLRGAFVIFADQRYTNRFAWGAAYGPVQGLSIEAEKDADNWSLLRILSRVEVTRDHG
jgi:hypothetical protein